MVTTFARFITFKDARKNAKNPPNYGGFYISGFKN